MVLNRVHAVFSWWSLVMKAKLTQSLVGRVPSPLSGKVLYADTELRGFYFIVSAMKRVFYVQSSVNGKQVRVKIGDHPAMEVKLARDVARQTLVSMRSGVNPAEHKRKAKQKGMTLQEVLELHLSVKALSPKTVQGYRYNCQEYLGDWLGRPLSVLGQDRVAVRERHVELTRQHGLATADGVMRVFRALYNRALRECPELPGNPACNVDFHGIRHRKVNVSTIDLAAWGKAVLQLENPVRRDLHLFMLLTGMRRSASCEARIEHLNHKRDTLHVPKPKGGSARAFDLPLSPALQSLISRRMNENSQLYRGSPWLFPANSRTGHIAEVYQAELDNLTGHALRHLYATLALEAGVPIAELKFLLNHAVGNVTMGYLHPSTDYLRSLQEKASVYILDKLGLVHVDGVWPPSLTLSN